MKINCKKNSEQFSKKYKYIDIMNHISKYNTWMKLLESESNEYWNTTKFDSGL